MQKVQHILNSHTALYYDPSKLSQEEMAQLIEDELQRIDPEAPIARHVLALGPGGVIDTSFGAVDPGEVIIHAPFIKEHQGFPLRALTPVNIKGGMYEFGYLVHRKNEETRTEHASLHTGFTDYEKAVSAARSSGKSPYCVAREFTVKPDNNKGYISISRWHSIET